VHEFGWELYIVYRTFRSHPRPLGSENDRRIPFEGNPTVGYSLVRLLASWRWWFIACSTLTILHRTKFGFDSIRFDSPSRNCSLTVSVEKCSRIHSPRFCSTVTVQWILLPGHPIIGRALPNYIFTTARCCHTILWRCDTFQWGLFHVVFPLSVMALSSYQSIRIVVDLFLYLP